MRVSIAVIAALSAVSGCAEQEAAVEVRLRSNRLPDGVFDRLTIEVRPGDASAGCVGCVREFSAEALTRSGEATFDVVAPGQPSVVRAVLWRSRGKGIRASSSVAVTAALAPGASRAELRLAWDAVGREVGSWEQPADPATLPPLPADPPVGGGCDGAPGEGEACVPGGLFWLGDPSIDLLGGVDREGTDERLVVLSPFWIDTAEVTVEQMRASGLATEIVPVRRESNPLCTYTKKPGKFEHLPVTCVTWPLADQYCRSRGGRLPTEAELEFLMGGRLSRRYVWGDDAPTCDDAIHGEQSCGRTGPELSGQGKRDRLPLGERAVVDLIGNVAEWASDRWNSTREPCFAAPLLRDPLCAQPSPSKPVHRVVRGGGWSLDEAYLAAPLRLGLDGERAYSEEVGWRCARGGAP